MLVSKNKKISVNNLFAEIFIFVAERVGFEPTCAFTLTDFESASL